jgi:histidyl-tRNA synthetase
MDALRAARIPTSQSFDALQLAPQLAAARQSGVAHIIIMGAREALDRTVIVRNARNSAQEVVPLQELPHFLKTLRV